MSYSHECQRHPDCDDTFPGLAKGATELGECHCDALIAGEFPQVVRKVTITGDMVLARGSVLGRIHSDDCHPGADRYCFLSESGTADGSSMPDAILAQTVDTRGCDQEAYVYFSGEFNHEAVIFPDRANVEEVTHVLRKRSIFLH